MKRYLTLEVEAEKRVVLIPPSEPQVFSAAPKDNENAVNNRAWVTPKRKFVLMMAVEMSQSSSTRVTQGISEGKPKNNMKGHQANFETRRLTFSQGWMGNTFKQS